MTVAAPKFWTLLTLTGKTRVVPPRGSSPLALLTMALVWGLLNNPATPALVSDKRSLTNVDLASTAAPGRKKNTMTGSAASR